MAEIWKTVVGHEGYEVSSEGRVRSARKLLKQCTNARGKYLWVGLRGGNARTVHSLVADAFLGERPEGQQVRHLDGNPRNNAHHNLAYGTPVQNTADRVLHGNHFCGERNPSAKLTAKQVAAIRVDRRLQRVIAAEYGVVRQTVSKIKGGTRWQPTA